MKLPISVIVLTKNSEATIQRCIESVRHNNPCEIIVVDGYSTDKTMDIAKRYTSRIYFDERKGLCYARQLGAEVATGEYVAYVDSDVILSSNTLETMLTELKTNGYGSITARQLLQGATGYLDWALTQYKNVIDPERAGETKVIPMRATIFPRELVLKYKFDLSTPNADGASIGFRLLEGGHRLGMSSVFVYHYHPSGRKGRPRYWEGVAAAEFLLKHKSSPAWVARYTLGTLGSPIYRMLKSMAKGELRLIPYFVYVFLTIAAGFVSKLSGALLSVLKGHSRRKET